MATKKTKKAPINQRTASRIWAEEDAAARVAQVAAAMFGNELGDALNRVLSGKRVRVGFSLDVAPRVMATS